TPPASESGQFSSIPDRCCAYPIGPTLQVVVGQAVINMGGTMIVNTLGAGQVVGPFLDGRLSQSDSEAAVEVINPSNGRHLLSIPAGCEPDVNRAVASA